MASIVEPFDTVDLIRVKRGSGELSTAQIDWLIDAYTRGYVGDEQMAAMTMAIFLNGMERREIRDMTLAMIRSGETSTGTPLCRSSASTRSLSSSSRPTSRAWRSRRSSTTLEPTTSPITVATASPEAVTFFPDI